MKKTRAFILLLAITLCWACRKPVIGCTDPSYGNYNPDANEDDGCCCTIVTGPNHREFITLDVFDVPIPNVPDTIAQVPSIEIEARAFREDQTADGPCGCLRGSFGLWNQGYTHYYGGDSRRKICFTSIFLCGRLLPYPPDTSVWNAISSSNGFSDRWPKIRIQYSIRFEGADGSNVALNVTDTLIFSGSYIPRFYEEVQSGMMGYNARSHEAISGSIVPCALFSIDSSNVVIEPLSISFMP